MSRFALLAISPRGTYISTVSRYAMRRQIGCICVAQLYDGPVAQVDVVLGPAVAHYIYSAE